MTKDTYTTFAERYDWMKEEMAFQPARAYPQGIVAVGFIPRDRVYGPSVPPAPLAD